MSALRGSRTTSRKMAEREGFEPSVVFSYARFPGVCLKPLSHLSRMSHANVKEVGSGRNCYLEGGKSRTSMSMSMSMSTRTRDEDEGRRTELDSQVGQSSANAVHQVDQLRVGFLEAIDGSGKAIN